MDELLSNGFTLRITCTSCRGLIQKLTVSKTFHSRQFYFKHNAFYYLVQTVLWPKMINHSMFSQSIEQLRKQILQHKQKPSIKNIYSVKWLLLSKAIQPCKLTYSDIEYELEKNRFIFKQLYIEYHKTGKFMHESDDIITKDVRRLDQNMILNLDFSSVWPNINANGFRNCVLVITRIIVRYNIPCWSTKQYIAEYFQGMHEIIAFILYIFIKQLSQLTLQEINATQGCVSCKLDNILADTYLLSKHVLKSILPIFQDNDCLENICQNIYKYIKVNNDKFYNEIQKQLNELPPIITFAQKSIKLIFLRDFDLIQHAQDVWDYIFAFNTLNQGAEDQQFQFLSYLVAQLYVWRYINKDKLKLSEFISIFLEQNLLFPAEYELEMFIVNAVNSYGKIIDINSMISMNKSIRNVESSDGFQSVFQEEDVYNIQSLFEKNQLVMQQINRMIDKIQGHEPQQSCAELADMCKQAVYILNSDKDLIETEANQDDAEAPGRIHTLGDLLGERRRLLCLRQFIE